jgi:hypothetical protein
MGSGYYEFAGLLAFVIVAVRLGFRTGPRLPLIFSGVAIAAYLAWPLTQLPISSVFPVAGVGIVMAAVDRAKTLQEKFRRDRMF